MRRVVAPELLDCDAGSAEEIAASLADLRMINRWFGGVRTHTRLLEEIARKCGTAKLSLLDVGGATGELARAVAQRLARRGITLTSVALDRSVGHLRAERSVVGDTFALPFADGSFDVVGSCLFAHHFEPAELQALIREMLRVARLAVVVNDLRRSYFHLAMAYAAVPLYRSRLTRHDSIVSVRRSYTCAEMRSILRACGSHVEVRRFPFFRLGGVVWKAA